MLNPLEEPTGVGDRPVPGGVTALFLILGVLVVVIALVFNRWESKVTDSISFNSTTPERASPTTPAPEPSTTSEPAPPRLALSENRGLLGVPLPIGARMISSTQGKPAEYVDPSQRYEIEATARQILEFFEEEMIRAGWILFLSFDNSLTFKRNGKMLGVLTNNDGGTFTLMGS